jgi:23S rRNA pseudouridine1911/1915/1917 synthase
MTNRMGVVHILQKENEMDKRNAKDTSAKHNEPRTKNRNYTVTEAKPLMMFLRDEIQQKSRNYIKGILARGQVAVGGKVITAHDHMLRPQDIVSISFDKVIDTTALVGVRIVFEDDDILIVDKEAGLLTIATDKEKTMTAYHQLTDYVKQKQAQARIFIVHRLDRDTSGILIFAKNEKTKKTLQENWQADVKQRTYIAVVEGVCKQKEGKIVSWLTESKSFKMHSSPTPNGGQEAITEYRVTQSANNYSLIELNLHTGRKNQIRVHMQHIGHPVVGDDKYGSKKNPIKRLALHAHTLVFKHPVSGKEMRFDSPVPRSFHQLLRTMST